MRTDPPAGSRDERLDRVIAAREARDIASLIDALNDTDSLIRGSAARSLGLLGDPTAVEPLLRLLDANDDGLRVNALRALRGIGDDAAVPGVYEVASGPSPLGVKTSAILTLGSLGDRRAVGLLTSLLTGDLAEAMRVPSSSTM